MISNPPANADPLTAAINGLAKSRLVIPPKPLSVIGNSPVANAFKSIPAEKALSPAPVKMTTQQSSSASSSSSAPPRAWAVAKLIAFRASGRLIVRISMCPLRSLRISSAIASSLGFGAAAWLVCEENASKGDARRTTT